MLLEVIQAVIPLLGMWASGGVESLRATSRAQRHLPLAQGSTEVHSRSLMPRRCLQSSEKREATAWLVIIASGWHWCGPR